MRVVQSVFTWLPLTQHWLWIQIGHLPPLIESTVVASCSTGDASPAWPSVRVLRLGSWEPARLSRRLSRRLRARLLRRAIEESDAALVHSHFGDQAWEDVGTVRRSGRAHVATFYGYDVGWLPRSSPAWRERYALIFAAVDRVLCEGPAMAASIAELGCPADKLQVHHHGVEMDRIPFAPRRWRRAEPLRVLLAASFVEKKGIPYGLRALARLATSIPLEITLIGDSNNTRTSLDEKEVILRTLSEERLEGKTRLLGYRSHHELHQEAAAHHVFLQPSVTARTGDSEGGAPVSLIEMAASGMPIVSTRHCDIPEVVVDGSTGWLADERDVDSLVSALGRWVDRPDSWEPMLVAGRRRMEAEFDADRQGQRLAAIYDDVVSRKAGWRQRA